MRQLPVNEIMSIDRKDWFLKHSVEKLVISNEILCHFPELSVFEKGTLQCRGLTTSSLMLVEKRIRL